MSIPAGVNRPGEVDGGPGAAAAHGRRRRRAGQPCEVGLGSSDRGGVDHSQAETSAEDTDSSPMCSRDFYTHGDFNYSQRFFLTNGYAD